MNNYVKSISLLQQNLEQSTEQLNTVIEELDKVYKERERCLNNIDWIQEKIDALEKKHNILVNFKSVVWNKCKVGWIFHLFTEMVIVGFTLAIYGPWIPFLVCCSLFNAYLCIGASASSLKEEWYVKRHYKVSNVEKDLKKNEDELSLLNEKKNDLDRKIDELEKQESEVREELENIDDTLNEFIQSYRMVMDKAIHVSKVAAFKKEISELGDRYSHELDVILDNEYEKQGMGLKLVKEEEKY